MTCPDKGDTPRGRRPLPAEERERKRDVNFSDRKWALARDAARAEGQPLRTWIREVAVRAARAVLRRDKR